MVKNWKAIFDRMRAALMRRGWARHEADDLMQEAWLKLACYERQHRVDEPEAFLMRTALNLSIDAFRARKRHGDQILLDESALADGAPSLEDALAAREALDRLVHCLARLDAGTREIFIQYRLHGVSFLEIAQAQGLSVTDVEKRIAKAALLITRAMKGWYP